jgi:hypothetical protein
MAIKLTLSEKNLIKRYLLWCFKTTRESLDRVDRKFTQVQVDRYILESLEKGSKRKNISAEYFALLDGFKDYIHAKEKDGIALKFSKSKPDQLNAEYLYLQNRIKGIERAVVYFLGSRVLSEFILQYESEMTRRILESREH